MAPGRRSHQQPGEQPSPLPPAYQFGVSGLSPLPPTCHCASNPCWQPPGAGADSSPPIARHSRRAMPTTCLHARLSPLPAVPPPAPPCCPSCVHPLRRPSAPRPPRTRLHLQYNTCFWALVKAGATPNEAQATLQVGSWQQPRVPCAAGHRAWAQPSLPPSLLGRGPFPPSTLPWASTPVLAARPPTWRPAPTPPRMPLWVQGSDAGVKNELLFSRFGINYSHLPDQFRKVRCCRRCTRPGVRLGKASQRGTRGQRTWGPLPTHAGTRPRRWAQGSIVLRQRQLVAVKQRADGTAVERERQQLAVLHGDLIGDAFWENRPELLAA